jgi:hypothetical protein
MGIENTVKEILKKGNFEPKKIQGGWLYEVNATGNPYEDFRDEYADADMIDVRIAIKALPNSDEQEKYFVIMDRKELSKSKLQEIHNSRFAEHSNDSLIVKKKEDLVADWMDEYGIKPGSGIRKTPIKS